MGKGPLRNAASHSFLPQLAPTALPILSRTYP